MPGSSLTRTVLRTRREYTTTKINDPSVSWLQKQLMKKTTKHSFEYRMDQYTRSGIVGRDTTKENKSLVWL